jgi:hypothetical protein
MAAKPTACAGKVERPHKAVTEDFRGKLSPAVEFRFERAVAWFFAPRSKVRLEASVPGG